MPKDSESRASSTEEKELRELERLLSKLATEGALEFPIPEAIVRAHEKTFSPDTEQRLWATIQADDQIRQRLKAARKSAFHGGLSFPELIGKLRTQAGLSVGQVAQALRLPLGDLQAIEEGRVDPLQLATETMADMLETFSLRLSVLEQSLKLALARRTIRAQLSPPSARTAGKISLREYGRVLDDVASFLAEEDDEISQATLPHGYLEQLETSLKRRGRDDLV